LSPEQVRPLGSLPEEQAPALRLLDAWNAALVFWEPRRLVYNGLLLALTLLVLTRPGHLARMAGLRPWCELVLCVGSANLCYCAAYPVDLVLQYATSAPRLWRNLLFLLGLAFSLGLSLVALAGVLRL
jgi:hypothetical protein